MPGIIIKDSDKSIEQMLKLFKKQTESAGTLREVRNRAFYEKPSVKKKKKRIMARKRQNKLTRY